MRSLNCSWWSRSVTAALAALCLAYGAQAADLTIKKLQAKPPAELAPEIAAVIQDEAVQLGDASGPVYEFWFVKSVECKSKPASTEKALDAVKETALLGVVKIHKKIRDFRDDDLPAGVYTLRFGLQPQDGDHLGSAPYPWFAVLLPAAIDKSPGTMTDHKAMTDASKEKAPAEHPSNLSLWPVAKTDGEFPATAAGDEEHKYLRLKVPAIAGSDTFDLFFGVVYQGKGHV
jgi:hypothetical protein